MNKKELLKRLELEEDNLVTLFEKDNLSVIDIEFAFLALKTIVEENIEDEKEEVYR